MTLILRRLLEAAATHTAEPGSVADIKTVLGGRPVPTGSIIGGDGDRGAAKTTDDGVDDGQRAVEKTALGIAGDKVTLTEIMGIESKTAQRGAVGDAVDDSDGVTHGDTVGIAVKGVLLTTGAEGDAETVGKGRWGNLVEEDGKHGVVGSGKGEDDTDGNGGAGGESLGTDNMMVSGEDIADMDIRIDKLMIVTTDESQGTEEEHQTGYYRITIFLYVHISIFFNSW